ncbi:hotdog fold thioesterase [Alicyclobacillus tolerans]|uniref:hotdog fold thioesterase n=1 Tax=Alicyclobacillus tolerans TaxID=90970 RepID=UPI001EFFA33E|nr:hotdog fold thioesterase [Alicyclobacillus tolerans]MCF8568088.1 hotdog fold thioesterase [Alicyclobacillus tolerans]
MQKIISSSLQELFKNDPYAQQLGFEIVDVSPGYAQVTAVVSEDTLNFAGSPHGGFLFSLADYAFAVASNAHGRQAVATTVSIQFYQIARPGTRLRAQAQETHLTYRTGYYDMTVTTEDGLLIAKCQGMVYRTSREWESQKT